MLLWCALEALTKNINGQYMTVNTPRGTNSRQINTDAFKHRAFSHRTVIMSDQMTSLSLSQVSRNIRCGLYQIKSVSASKSDVWTKFGLVTTTDGVDLDYAACKSCHAVMTYCGRKTCTSTMKRHKCRFSTSTQGSIASHCVPKAPHISKSTKDAITCACADLSCIDLRPFDIVAGDGFTRYTQELLNIQHKSSTLLRATDLLPNPTTVSRNISSRADTVKTDLAITLQSAYKDNGSISFTSDMWTDAHRKRSYITITAHFITPAWTLCSRVLCTEEFDPAAKKTGVNVRLSMLAVFASYGITTSQISRSVFTTDRGSNTPPPPPPLSPTYM